MNKYIKFMAFAMMAVFSLALVSCGGNDDDGPTNYKYGQININGKDYACYGYDMPFTYESLWEDEFLLITLPIDNLADAQKGEYELSSRIDIDCFGGSKPSVGTNLADYPQIETVIVDEGVSAAYESGSAIVKSVKEDDYITIEFKNFKCKAKANSTQSYTFNGTVKLSYNVE